MERKQYRERGSERAGSYFENRNADYRNQGRKYVASSTNKKFFRRRVYSPTTESATRETRDDSWEQRKVASGTGTKYKDGRTDSYVNNQEKTLNLGTHEKEDPTSAAEFEQTQFWDSSCVKEWSGTPSVTPSPSSPPPSPFPSQGAEKTVSYKDFHQLQNDITKSRVEIQSLRVELQSTNSKLDEVCQQLQDLRRELDTRLKNHSQNLHQKQGEHNRRAEAGSMETWSGTGISSSKQSAPKDVTLHDFGKNETSSHNFCKLQKSSEVGSSSTTQTNVELSEEGWLYCCKKGEQVDEILQILELQGSSVFKVNIGSWTQESQVSSDLRALAHFLDVPLNMASNEKLWDMASRVITVACKKDTFLYLENCDTVATASPGNFGVKARINLAYFIQTIARAWARLEKENANCLGRIVVVLEGWPKDRVIGSYKVEQLP